MMWFLNRSVGVFVLLVTLVAVPACEQAKTSPSSVPGEQATAAASSTSVKAPKTAVPSVSSQAEKTAASGTATAEVAAAAPPPGDSARAASPGLATAAPVVSVSASPLASADEKVATAPAVASASAVATAEKAPLVTGGKSAEAAYAAWMQSSSRYTAGKPGSVQAVLIAKEGFKCNPNYPYKFKLGAPSAGVSYPQAIARNVTKGDKRSVLTVPLVPSSAGKKTISGTFHFSVCNDEVCHIKRQAMSLQIEVQEPGES